MTQKSILFRYARSLAALFLALDAPWILQGLLAQWNASLSPYHHQGSTPRSDSRSGSHPIALLGVWGHGPRPYALWRHCLLFVQSILSSQCGQILQLPLLGRHELHHRYGFFPTLKIMEKFSLSGVFFQMWDHVAVVNFAGFKNAYGPAWNPRGFWARKKRSKGRWGRKSIRLRKRHRNTHSHLLQRSQFSNKVNQFSILNFYEVSY